MKLVHRRFLATIGAAGLCATVLGTGGSAQAAGSFTDPSSGTTSTYEAVDGNFTWDEANAAASGTAAPEGCTSHLAVITSQAEQDYIHAQLGAQPTKYIGAQRTEEHGPFAWVTGEAFDYTNWNPGEPNDNNGNGGPENNLQFAYAEDNTWNDIDGNANQTGYILETQCDAPPAPGPLMVTGVDPAHGPAAGGNTVTINGSGFTGATKVRFGAKTATTYTVESDTQISVTVPSYKAQVGPRGSFTMVRVYVGKHKSPKVRADRYKYDASSTAS